MIETATESSIVRVVEVKSNVLFKLIVAVNLSVDVSLCDISPM